jgi:hypothetical protein
MAASRLLFGLSVASVATFAGAGAFHLFFSSEASQNLPS